MTEFFMWMMQVLITNSCNSLSVTNLNMINSPKSHIHVNGFEVRETRPAQCWLPRTETPCSWFKVQL